MCTMNHTMTGGKKSKHPVVHLCAKAQLLKGGKVCADTEKKRKEYIAKNKLAKLEQQNA